MAYGGNPMSALGIMADMPNMSPDLPASVMIPPPMIPPTMKPACGVGGPRKQYDVAIHVLGLSSCFGAGFPVVAKKFKKLRIPPTIFFFCKHFGTGVLIATAFVHLLPTAFQSLNNPCLPDFFTVRYPAVPGVIGLGSMFMLFAIEMWMHTKMPGAHSHGSATGEEFAGSQPEESRSYGPPLQHQKTVAGDAMFSDEDYPTYLEEKTAIVYLGDTENDSSSNMPSWFLSFYEQYMRQRTEMLGMIKHYAPTLPRYKSQESHSQTKPYVDETKVSKTIAPINHLGILDLERGSVDPMVYRKMSLEITLLEGGILFHSVFVGMTVSITTDSFIVLLIAILFHQTFEGLGLGSRIAAVPYPKCSIKPWLLVFAFGTTAPIGQAIGFLTRNTYDPNSAFALILVGFFNAFLSGLLIYAGLVDLLHADFLSEQADRLLTNKKKTMAFAFVLMGAASMSIVGAFA